jgi:hypothetical protein
MTNHSNAAKAWARQEYATDLRIPIGNVAIAAMNAFDAGAASVAPPESIVCMDYPNCTRGHAGGAGGVPVHPPVGARISGDEPIPGYVPATPEPERLDDPDDPRIRVGATVRQVSEYRLSDDGEDCFPEGVMNAIRLGTDNWYLVEEAPAPDADALRAIIETLDETDVDISTPGLAAAILDGLRFRGVLS